MNIGQLIQAWKDGGSSNPVHQATTPAPQTTQAQTGQANPIQPAAFQTSTTADPSTQTPASPMDIHADLFKMAAVDPANRPLGLDDAYININPTELNAEIAKINFVDDGMRDTIAKVSGGNPETAAAFTQLLNMMGQSLYGRTATLSATLADQATRQGVTRLNNEIPNTVRSNLTNEAMTTLNPLFQHEAASPMVYAVRKQIEAKFPNATSAEIAGKTAAYFNDFAKTLNPAQISPQAKAEQGQDFSQFF